MNRGGNLSHFQQREVPVRTQPVADAATIRGPDHKGVVMKKSQGLLPLLALVAAFIAPGAAHATVFAINCGAGGPATALQAQIASIGSTPGHQINVTGSCVGDIDTSRADRLTIAGLTITGSITMTAANTMRFLNLSQSGSLLLMNTRNSSFSNTKIRGDITVMRGSQAIFTNLTSAPWSDSTGTHDPAFNCIGQSECTLNLANLAGAGTSTTSVGALAASASRLNFTAGTITGFGTGLQAWNNATAFVTANCDPITIKGNLVAGVSVLDSGVAKVFGLSKADAGDFGCSGGEVAVDIASNGQFGVFADGGGNAYLQITKITGHALDGVRVQHGSVVRVRNSSIDAASSSGRSARVKAQAHLYFDEQEAGPSAGSSLAGPVCVTGSSTADTDNSSTALTVVTSCPGP
jgi:hypothetical protein